MSQSLTFHDSYYTFPLNLYLVQVFICIIRVKKNWDAYTISIHSIVSMGVVIMRYLAGSTPYCINSFVISMSLPFYQISVLIISCSLPMQTLLYLKLRVKVVYFMFFSASHSQRFTLVSTIWQSRREAAGSTRYFIQSWVKYLSFISN